MVRSSWSSNDSSEVEDGYPGDGINLPFVILVHPAASTDSTSKFSEDSNDSSASSHDKDDCPSISYGPVPRLRGGQTSDDDSSNPSSVFESNAPKRKWRATQIQSGSSGAWDRW
ncbi:hypothetical protein DFH07DRAFT_771850 [Mycena maculata]|uniref:Uncharacterized protein n=1 Tax=Mycena maculata TaxID=230809 RepID=A0AAD7JB77_9AGAR|nr:hypothetical protein DFH07DRAFT_771850 [Mycena maculata]